MKALKTALVIAITGVVLSFGSQAKAMADEDIPTGNVGAICANGKKVSATGSGACLNYWGRKFWVMPNGKKIPSQDYLDPWFLDEPYYSNWRVCNLQPDVKEWRKCHDRLKLKFPHEYLDDETPIDSGLVTSVAPPSVFGSIGAVGATCADGWRSYSAGSGTCSWHGGVRNWEYYNPVIINFPPIKPIVIKPIDIPPTWKIKIPCYVNCG